MPSFRQERFLSLASSDLAEKPLADLKEILKQHLTSGVHGFCASPYLEGQKPGDQLTEEQIRKRLEVLKPHTKWIRSFSTTEGNELIPKVARELGIKTMVGAWLGDDPETNRKEVANLIELVNQGLVDIAAVGNEVLYRGDLTEAELLEYIHEVKSKIQKDVHVGYVDAYYEFHDHPAVADACDVILANCYPFWEGCPLEHSLLYMKEMFRIATEAGKGKRVIITETGWPDQGSNLRGAEPSTENAIKYFINAQQWSKEDGIELFYFSSFDESWKVGNEGDVGAFWGVWDKNEQLKY
ncbi:glycosyl hydrolase family 17 protein [Algoriphagus namhaensis]|uniref:Endo-1,3-beta-glucanase btgC n=1 Tax=Algoriphagus namhaensis TaxID=915353 RepID=A0ABV8AUA9_9BACT